MLQGSLTCFVVNPVCLFLELVDGIMFSRLSKTTVVIDEEDPLRMPGEDPADCGHDAIPTSYVSMRSKIEEEVSTMIEVQEMKDEPDLVLVDILFKPDTNR